MISFPSIGQFKQAVSAVIRRISYSGDDELGNPIYARTYEKPTLEFVGSVKLHGTNASVGQKSGEIFIQSRRRRITVDDDNANFAKFVRNDIGDNIWEQMFEQIRKDHQIDQDVAITIYGEWCGGNIQKNVGIAGLEKMFVIFAVRLGEENQTQWLSINDIKNITMPYSMRVRSIFEFSNYSIVIDFENPGLSQNKLIELTNLVEEECPVAKSFDVSGVGEGIVWRCVTPGYERSEFWFKVKGEKHSVTKVKKLAAVDVERLNSISEFVENVLTEQRLLQGIDYLKEMKLELSQKSTGQYIQWIIGDIMKEESDTMEASELTPKEVNKRVAVKAKVWFFEWNKNNSD